MPSPAHSSRTSPSVDMSPQPLPHEENDEEMAPLVWDVVPGIEGIPSKYDSKPPPKPVMKTISHEKPPPPKGPVYTNCPAITGKMKNQFNSRKTAEEALKDCGDDEALRKCVRACIDSEEYNQRKIVPAELLSALSEVMGVRSQSKCRFPNCGRVNVRTDRAKEHARMHIGNHPYKCTRTQADGSTGCGATFLRKHDRNRHDNGADTLRCEDCGAVIQGKGREYNLQRHRTNYCSARKAPKQASEPESSSSPTSHAPLPVQLPDLNLGDSATQDSSQPQLPLNQNQTQNQALTQSQGQPQPLPINGTGPLHGSLASGPGLVSNTNPSITTTGTTVTAGGN